MLTVVPAGCTYSAELDVDRLSCDQDRPCPGGQPCSADGYCTGTEQLGDASSDGSAASYESVILVDEPILYVRLDAAGATVVADSSGNGRDGVVLGGPAVVDGVAGSAAVEFDGVDDGIQWNDDSALRLDGSFTIELWAKLVSPINTYPGLVRKGVASDSGYLIYYPTDDASMTLAFKRAGQFYESNASLSTSSFRHLVITYDQPTTALRWYVDGLLTAAHSEAVFAPADAAELSIGVGDERGNHIIDEFALYDHALASGSVLDHFAAGTARRR